MTWFRKRQAIIFTPSVAQRFKLFGCAFDPKTAACNSRIVVTMAVNAVPICSALYSLSNEMASSKFVRYEM